MSGVRCLFVENLFDSDSQRQNCKDFGRFFICGECKLDENLEGGDSHVCLRRREREREKWRRGCFVRSPSTCSPGPFFCQSPRDPCNFLSRKLRRGFNAPLSQLPPASPYIVSDYSQSTPTILTMNSGSHRLPIKMENIRSDTDIISFLPLLKWNERIFFVKNFSFYYKKELLFIPLFISLSNDHVVDPQHSSVTLSLYW